MTSARAFTLDRTIPAWGIACALAAMVGTGAGVVWNLAGIAHDVTDVKAALLTIQSKQEERDARVSALDARVTRIETSVQFLEGKNHEQAPYAAAR